MGIYLLKRVLATVPVVAVVALFVSALLYISPGDPAAVIAGDTANPAQIAAIRSQLGLDKPFLVQFSGWVFRLLHGDLGVSIFSNLPVSQLIAQRLEPTIALTLTTMFLAIVTAVPLGALAARFAGSWFDRAVMLFAVVGFSFPGFVVAYIMILVFAVMLPWFPVQGYRPISDGLAPFFTSIALPSITLGINYIALIARITRATMIETLSEDYVRTATAKGLPTFDIIFRHALKNAAVPIVTVIGVGISMLMGGVVIIESVFAIPGLGRLIVDAILHRDYTVIQGVIILFSLTYVVVNMIVDILYTLLDPRIRY